MSADRKTTARGGTIRVRQYKSGIGYGRDQKATLKALGLGRIGRIRMLPDNPQVRGMVAKIPHLVEILAAEVRGSAADRSTANEVDR